MAVSLIQANEFEYLDIAAFLRAVGALVSCPAKDLLSINQAAECRGVTREAIYDMAVLSKTLPSIRMADGKVYIRKSDLDALPPVRHPNARKFRKVGKVNK